MSQPSFESLRLVQDKVRKHFGWSLEADMRSVTSMASIFCGPNPYGNNQWSPANRALTLNTLQDRILASQELIFVGAAVESKEIPKVKPKGTEYIVADGAVGAFTGKVAPLCVVSDFDGQPYLEEAMKHNIPLVLHAHGDNIDLWKHSFETWAASSHSPPIVLTHQTPEVFDGIQNVGGFTDGDRAVCFAYWCGLQHSNIKFLGYDKNIVGKWSGHTTIERKLAKLQWMEEILLMFPCYVLKDEHSKEGASSLV